MKLPATFFRSKVARRIVLLFVSCALLPVTVLAILSFYEVSSQLRAESQTRLMQSSRSQGMAIYEHLEMLDSDLQVLSSQVQEGQPLATGHVPQGHLKGLALFGADGGQRAHWGEAVTLPQLDAAERRHLLAGNSLLRIGNCGSAYGKCVFMLRMAAAGESESAIVIAELDPSYLWAANSLSPDLQFCVFSSSRAVLFCSNEGQSVNAASFPWFRSASGFFRWEGSGTRYDAAYWKLLVKPAFFQDSWTIAVSQDHAAVLAPMVHFQNSFPLVILLSLWIVLLLSLVQVRRTLGPLEKLREGTRQIGAGHFDSRVEVRSGDEFEGLATSFNSMAAQLGRQFHTLTTINEIDQAIFASLDREAIVDGALAHMPGLLPNDCFGVCVFEDTGISGWTRFRDIDTGQVQTETLRIPAIDWKQLQNHPQAFTIAGQQRIPSYLVPLGRAGMRSFLILPIQAGNSIQAALVCAQRNPQAPTLENLPGARQVADQLAVAFAHVGLMKALEQLHLGTLTALARAIDAKSQWTAGHSERVTQLAIEIGRNMGLGGKELKILHMGGLLHDIGKIGTPPAILDKPGKLTDEEMRTMRDHVRTGVRILEPIPGFAKALPIVSQHHEWVNGKGYPAGIAGKEISLYARIFAVADCFDALTSDRPYRRGLPAHQALAMLREQSGVQFDPDVIKVFTGMMADSMREQEAAAACAGQLQ